MWTGYNWRRIDTSGGVLWTQLWTFDFYKMMEASRPAERLLASQEGFCFTELVKSEKYQGAE
jgi:hypothetical protein